MRTIKGQVFASTALDAHGEQRDKQFLDDLLASLPERMPLNQHHDIGRPTVGHMENFHVEQDGEGWALKCDVTFSGDPPASGGFSFSTTEVLHRPENPAFSVYVPYPYYNDETLLTELVNTNQDSSVGRWIKKSIEVGEIALVVSTLSLLFSPLWKKTYDDLVHPRLVGLVTSVKDSIQRKSGGRNPRVDYLQPVHIPEYQEHIELYFIPSEHAETTLVYGFAMKDAIGEGMDLVHADWEQTKKPIRRIVYVFDPDACRYCAKQIIYANGDTRND